jgi:pimeloyl-ACP methyl ester carboxylesterase
MGRTDRDVRRAGVRAVFCEILGLRLRYLTAGTGPAVMLVHPVGYPAEIFARNIDALAAGFTVVAPDLPGQGFSAAPACWDAAPQEVMAGAVLALADHLGIDRFTVVGSSLGALVAARVALRHPERVDGLVLIGSGSVFNEPAGQPEVLGRVFANGSSAYRDPSLETCRARLANTCHSLPSAEDILLTQITAYALPGALDAYRAIIDGLCATIADPRSSAYAHLAQIRARTLVMVGADDVRTSFAAHAAGAARMPDARIVSYDACGHLPFLERPDRFNADLLRFLSGEPVGERPAAPPFPDGAPR